jgi:hypothetical protein
MKKILFFILLIPMMSFHSTQSPQSIIAKWHSSIPLFEEQHISSYTFNKFQTNADRAIYWGYFVTFSADGTFKTNYSAPCGLDCFTSVEGNYKWIDEQHIALSVQKITRSDLCAKASQTDPFDLGVFEVVFNKASFSLTKR